jgi:hypothetical protein
MAPLKASIAFRKANGGKTRIPSTHAFLAEAMVLTGDLDNALQLIDARLSKSNAPAGRNAFTTPRSCASRAGRSRSKATS